MLSRAMTATKTTMFFDGGCPHCRRGVRHYERLDWARRVRWVDLIENPTALAPYGIDFPTALARLHVLDRNARMVSGIDAFSAIWAELPYYRILAKILRIPSLRYLAERFYRLMTRGRYYRRCGANGCSADPGR